MELLRKIKTIKEFEKAKYKNKGTQNILLSIAMLMVIFVIPVKIGQYLWPTDIQNIGQFVFVGTMVAHFIAQITIFLIFLPGYLNWLPFYDAYKVNKRSQWPWNRQSWKKYFPKTVYNLTMNQFFVYPLVSFASTLFSIDIRFNKFPTILEVFYQFWFVFFLEDVFFYIIHWYSHVNKKMYRMHKIHHQYDKVYSLVTQYFHPTDYLLSLITSSAGFMVLGGECHCFTLFFYITFKLMISSENHCGYEFPCSPARVLPFLAGPSFHDNHHSLNYGNFAGAFYILDVLFGTQSKEYFKQYSKIKQK